MVALLFLLTNLNPCFWEAFASKPPVPPADSARAHWNLARDAFSEGKWSDAAFELKKVLQNSPASTEYLDAQHLLGLCFLRLDDPQKALAPLQYTVRALGTSTEGLRARADLAHAYLRLAKFHEALLTAIEILEHEKKDGTPSADYFIEALLIKGWATLGLKKPVQAQEALASFKAKSQGVSAHEALLAQGETLELSIIIDRCKILPGKGPLNEAEVLTLIQRKSQCEMDALLAFKNALQFQNAFWLRKTTEALKLAWIDFEQSCRYPPSSGKKKSKSELKKYHQELVSYLSPECKKTRIAALENLSTWKPQLPPGSDLWVAEIEKTLRGLEL